MPRGPENGPRAARIAPKLVLGVNIKLLSAARIKLESALSKAGIGTQ